MNTRAMERLKGQRVFADLQSAVEKMVKEGFPGPTAPVQFHKEPSKHFFVYRPGRPSLRLDVKLADDFQSIRFATSTTAEAHFDLCVFAGGEVHLSNGPQRIAVDEATNLLLASFLE